MTVKKKSRKSKKHKNVPKCTISIFIFIGIAIAYISAFVTARMNARATSVKYFDTGEEVVYGGVKYSFTSEIYDIEELIQSFRLEEHLTEIKNSVKDRPALYVVTKVTAKKIENMEIENQIQDSFIIVNRYTNGAGKDYELQDLIQKKTYKKVQELETGEETEYYILNIIAKSSYCDKVWKHMKESVFYLEMSDYESREYITRVKVIDGKYGDFPKKESQ